MEKHADNASPETLTLIGRKLEIDHEHSTLADVDGNTQSAARSNINPSSNQVYENGRTYHSYDHGTYYLPNDDEELDRLEIQHEMWRVALNGALYISPIPKNVRSVLDIGTGTGVWAIRFAEQHPDTKVLGTDLSPVQAKHAPPNCSFIIDNAEKDWTLYRKFDFIHARMLIMGMHNWPRFFEQCWNHLEPGGWLELGETTLMTSLDDTPVEESPLLQWVDLVRRGAEQGGINTSACLHFEEQLRAQGFVNIRKERLEFPLGTWPKGVQEKRLGALGYENLKLGLESVVMAVSTRNLKMPREEIELLCTKARKDAKDPNRHYYAAMYMYSCQKPSVAGESGHA